MGARSLNQIIFIMGGQASHVDVPDAVKNVDEDEEEPGNVAEAVSNEFRRVLNYVTRRAILPGTTSGLMRKETQETTTNMQEGR